MAELKSLDTGVRSRTRKAILEAAIGVLATSPAASLSDIATAAGVGRSTLHRYFPERAALMRAVALHVHDMCNAAIDRAEPACGAPLAALRRVVEAQLDLGPIVPFIYNEPTIMADPELSAFLDTGDEAITELLERASTQPQTSPPGWPRLAFWALLDAGYAALRRNTAPRVEIIDAIMASLTSGTIAPDPS
ncbi:TetR family transcriptional regulator [Mycobacterium sp. CBMA 234]|uniref:TetR/AcrR family transcriptional regulator n=1 Tax=Mycolicibacterium sp. CBMA 234 TaxID=1918495 RepID=UPI0012DCEA79|nr:TetR/AcrR family transcriptional regulator [Mycolicibacterium sp. CBMA 234]MUL64763.1 TetR family transcriptional regulator [Mycolicibacterium sp. CBMA 234]